MNDRIGGPASQTSSATNAPFGNTASSAVPIGTAADGVVDDLGNLIEIPRSAESIVSRDPIAKASDDPDPADTHASASLERSGLASADRDALQGAA